MLKDIENLITSYLTGEISASDLNTLKNELKNNSNFRRLFDEYLDVWQSSIKTRKSEDYDETEAWRKIKSNINPDKKRSQHVPTTVFLQRIQQVAAAILILAFSGTLVFFLINNKFQGGNKTDICEYIIPYGSRSQVVLPDGSKIWLNSGTTLEYNGQFGRKNRNITMKGEAYFDVAKNKELPFVVNTSDLTIKVLGTAFNVKAYPDEDYIETTVERGIVQVKEDRMNKSDKDNIILKANQKLLYSKNPVLKENLIYKNKNKAALESIKKDNTETKLQVDQVSTKKYTSWKDNRWIIEREELQSLVVKLERRYNVTISITDESLKHYIFSGVLENETLEQVLEAIKLTAPILYKIDQKQVILSRNQYFKPN